MKLLNNIKSKSFRKKKGGKSIATEGAASQPIAPTLSPEDSAASPVTPSPVKERHDANESEELSPLRPLRPLQIGSYDFTTSYVFPSLHAEASTMLDLSLLIYTLSALRDLARNGVLNDPAKSLRILETPLPLDTAISIIHGEAGLLKEVLSDGEHNATLSALRTLLQKKEIKHQDVVEKEEDQGMFWGCLAGGFSFDEIFCGGDLGNVDSGKKIDVKKDDVDSSIIHTIGDAKCFEELVYAVEVNQHEERITVVFRGSVTKVDFATDANVTMLYVSEPTSNPQVADDIGEIGIHQGCYDYLFGSKNGKPNKYDQIMGHVQKLFRQDPNRLRHYKLYVTGHGLGGALATLFGYYCAALSSKHELSFAPPSRKEDLPLPINVVSVGSPRIGNLQFARSFTELESQAKLRHLRIAAHKDPMTLVPIRSSKTLPLNKTLSPLATLATLPETVDSEELYYHTGMCMKLREDFPAESSQRCEMTYAGANCTARSLKCQSEFDGRDEIESLAKESKRSSESAVARLMALYHFGEAYAERLSLVETDLSGLRLNRIYQEKACIANENA